MKRIKPTLALAVIFTVCGLFLASCGGGSGSGSSVTTINGISVPPEPDTTTNNATLAGVDSNSNGVRDDVERKIAERWPDKNQDAITAAVVVQKIILQQPISDAEDKASFCFLSTANQSTEELINLYTNNSDREAASIKNTGARTVWECE